MVEKNLGARSSAAAEADSRVASPISIVYSFFYNALLFNNNTVLSELTNAKTGAGRAVGLDAFATLRLLGLRFYFHLTPGSAADAAVLSRRRAKARRRNPGLPYAASPCGEALNLARLMARGRQPA